MAYRVVTTHERTGERVADFTTFDEARAYGATVSPEVDDTTIPQLAADVIERHGGSDRYEAGLFYAHVNRYGVIFNTEANYDERV